MTIRIAAFGAMIVCMTTPGHADEHAGRLYADYQTGREQAAASGLPPARSGDVSRAPGTVHVPGTHRSDSGAGCGASCTAPVLET